MSLVYLASPYSHPDPAVRERRYLSACLAAAKLMQAGQAVFCPIAHSHPIALCLPPRLVMDHEFWMHQDRAILRHAARLVVLKLDGWDISRGVTAEIHFAQRLGLSVEYLEP